MPRFLLAPAFALLLAASQAWAAPEIHVDEPWARATAAGQPAGGGYLKLHNAGPGADRLVGARSAAAERVELHTMQLDGSVMRMRQVDTIDLPEGKLVALEPGGFHLMFMGLKQPLKAGTRFPLELRFEKASPLTVEVEVKSATSLPPAKSGGHDAHKH